MRDTKEQAGASGLPRLPAAELESAVLEQLRGILRAPALLTWDVAATPIQLALARGHRWLAMLESGEAKSITELAAREKIDNS